jgi:hypothetical protein
MEQWLAMMHKAMSRNYDRLDGVLATLQSETRKGRPR